MKWDGSVKLRCRLIWVHKQPRFTGAYNNEVVYAQPLFCFGLIMLQKKLSYYNWRGKIDILYEGLATWPM